MYHSLSPKTYNCLIPNHTVSTKQKKTHKTRMWFFLVSNVISNLCIERKWQLWLKHWNTRFGAFQDIRQLSMIMVHFVQFPFTSSSIISCNYIIYEYVWLFVYKYLSTIHAFISKICSERTKVEFEKLKVISKCT